MATSMRLLPVRTTARVRAMIDRVGTVNAATRALLFIGAYRAGLELDGMDREIALLLAEDLDRRVASALRQVYSALMDSAEAADPVLMLPVAQAEHAPTQAIAVGGIAQAPTPATVPATATVLPFEPTEPAEADDPFAAVGIEV
jgi:hypothetical protein